MRTIIQQLEDLKEWGQDPTRYAQRLAFRSTVPYMEVLPEEFDELSDREDEYYRTGPWKTSREDYQKGQLVEPERTGFFTAGQVASKKQMENLKKVKKFTTTSGPQTGKGIDNPVNYKKVKSSLNKIKKQKNKKLFFDWKEGDAWYKQLSEDVSMGRDNLNKLLNQVVAEEFPGSYAGKAGRVQHTYDTVVKSFLAHFENVGVFDGNEKFSKILNQFEGDGDHRFEKINKAFKEWRQGYRITNQGNKIPVEVDGVNRKNFDSNLKKSIKNWKASSKQVRSLDVQNQLIFLNKLNNKTNLDLNRAKALFKKEFPDAINTFDNRLNQLTMLKRTGQYVSGADTASSITGIAKGDRAKWLKEGFGLQFKGNYSKFINQADKLFEAGNFKEARRLYAAADKYFGPQGIFTKAAGEGEHPLSRLMGGTDHQLKINSLVRGDLNQFKRLNFDEPLFKLANDYRKTAPGSKERKAIITEIENRKKLMNFLTESPTEKGIVDSVKFRYGPKSIGPSVDVVAIDKVKNFNVEDYVKRGQSYLDVFQKQGAKLGLIDIKTGTITQKAVNVNKMLQAAGFPINKCLNFQDGGSFDKCIKNVVNETIEKAKQGDRGALQIVKNQKQVLKQAAKRGTGLATKLSWFLGPVDAPIELAFALPHLLMGDYEAAKRVTTGGLFGWGKIDLDNVDDPEARKYLKHTKDTADWINNWEKHDYYTNKLENLPDDASDALRNDIEARINKRASNMDSIAQNYDGYDQSGSENEAWAYNPEEMAGKKAARNWINTKVETDLDKQLDKTYGPSDIMGVDIDLGPYKEEVKEKLRASPTDLESYIKTKGQDFYGDPEGWFAYDPLKREEAEAYGVGDIYDDYYMGASEGKDIRESYSSIPLEYASQLGALEAKETRDALEEIRERQLSSPLNKMYYAGGGIANVRRPNAIPPVSGPMPQGGGLSTMFNRVKPW